MAPYNSTRTHIIFRTILLAGLLLSLPAAWATSTISQSPGDLIINEVVAANQTGLTDEDGDTSDWIEIYNRGKQPVNLSGWSLTDDPAQPEKWTFPARTLDSQAYLLVFASGKDRQPTPPNSALHTNFKLKQQGEFLGLYNIFLHRFVDVVSPQPEAEENGEFPEQFDDIAYGRYLNSDHALRYGYFADPTPGQPNDETSLWVDLVAPVEFFLQFQYGFAGRVRFERNRSLDQRLKLLNKPVHFHSAGWNQVRGGHGVCV